MRAVIAALILVVSIAIGLPASAASWAWCSSDKEGTWQPGFGRWFVQNDAWSGSAGPQRICAHNVHSWTAWSTQRGTAVETYPDSQWIAGEAAGKKHSPYSSYKAIRSTFSITMPHGPGLSAEAAYDVWWGNGWDTKAEMMMWFYTVNRSLDGSNHIGTAHIYGQTFGVYEYPATSPGDTPEFVFKLNHNISHGTAHLLSAARWLVNHGYMSRSVGLTAVPFGYEIAGTGGRQLPFTLNNLTLTVKGGTG